MSSEMRCAVIFILLIFSISCAESQHWKQTTVCDVLRQRNSYSSQLVRIDAEVIADGMHYAYLIDSRCTGKALYLGVPLEDADQSIIDLKNAIRSHGSPGTAGRRVTATFIGRINPKLVHGKVQISLLSVRDLKSEAITENLP